MKKKNAISDAPDEHTSSKQNCDINKTNVHYVQMYKIAKYLKYRLLTESETISLFPDV